MDGWRFRNWLALEIEAHGETNPGGGRSSLDVTWTPPLMCKKKNQEYAFVHNSALGDFVRNFG